MQGRELAMVVELNEGPASVENLYNIHVDLGQTTEEFNQEANV